MAISLTVLDADMVALQADLSNTLLWTPTGGAQQSVTCMAGEVVREDDRTLAGIYQQRSLEIVARVAAFTNSVVPSVGNHITVDGQEYRSSRVEKSADGVQVRINLMRV